MDSRSCLQSEASWRIPSVKAGQYHWSIFVPFWQNHFDPFCFNAIWRYDSVLIVMCLMPWKMPVWLHASTCCVPSIYTFAHRWYIKVLSDTDDTVPYLFCFVSVLYWIQFGGYVVVLCLVFFTLWCNSIYHQFCWMYILYSRLWQNAGSFGTFNEVLRAVEEVQ